MNHKAPAVASHPNSTKGSSQEPLVSKDRHSKAFICKTECSDENRTAPQGYRETRDYTELSKVSTFTARPWQFVSLNCSSLRFIKNAK